MKQSKGDGVRGQGCRQKAPWAGGSRAPSAARWSPRPRQRAAQEGGAGNGSQRHPTLRQAFPPPHAPEVPGPAEPTGSPLTASPAGPTRSRKGSAGRGRPLTRLAERRAQVPGNLAGGAGSRWNPRGLAGAPSSGSAFSLFQMDGSRINSLLPFKKSKRE